MTTNISGYDLIGDIHGHAEELKEILKRMNYSVKHNVWQHPDRKVIFVGDYIDRGPAIRETLQIVKAMTDAGAAIAIMGNHEYNALAYNFHHPDGGYIRSHNAVHTKQHSATLQQFAAFESEWNDYLEWIANLPLFYENEHIRAVHACWDDNHIAALKKIESPLTKEILIAAHDKDHESNEVFEETLKGKELQLPDGHFFIDKDGHERSKCRTRWWLPPNDYLLGDYLFHAPTTVAGLPVPHNVRSEGYDATAKPVFFGHYWLEASQQPVWQALNACCLDYSVGKGGNLVAYRYFIGEEASKKNFVIVQAKN